MRPTDEAFRLYAKMWDIDPVDLWFFVILIAGYSWPFLALLLQFTLKDLKLKAEEEEARKAALRRLITGY